MPASVRSSLLLSAVFSAVLLAPAVLAADVQRQPTSISQYRFYAYPDLSQAEVTQLTESAAVGELMKQAPTAAGRLARSIELSGRFYSYPAYEWPLAAAVPERGRGRGDAAKPPVWSPAER